MMQRITWDEAKAESNLVKHGVTFREAQEVFDDQLSLTTDQLSLTTLDATQPAAENRFMTIGSTRRGRLLTVGHGDDGDEIRLITARESTKAERRWYEG